MLCNIMQIIHINVMWYGDIARAHTEYACVPCVDSLLTVFFEGVRCASVALELGRKMLMWACWELL